MEYTVVKVFDLLQFIEDVNKLIQEGWKPQGGIVVYGVGAHYYHYQAMIREAGKE